MGNIDNRSAYGDFTQRRIGMTGRLTASRLLGSVMKRRKNFQHPDQLELGLLFEGGGNNAMGTSAGDDRPGTGTGSETDVAAGPESVEPQTQDQRDKQDKQRRPRRKRNVQNEGEPEFALMREFAWQASAPASLPGLLPDPAEAASETESAAGMELIPEFAAHGPDSSQPDENPEPGIQEPRLWSDETWTVRIITHEAGSGWAAEIHRTGESEPVLVCPWEVDREKNPRPLDGSAFDMLVKTAIDMRRRQERQLQAMLHKSVTVQTRSALITVTLDIVPDEDDSHALLAATDDTGTQLAEVRVAPGFKLSQRVASAWVDSGYRKIQRV
ncbi:hypothetical protein RY831_19235 [Noviherbaspirillum sp. CPCC 100848]|uniref:DUF2169 domain-containing protein n=1 Tax=Noviherbaspirillum album TaxID=3080276 RepID=A0ABU6JDS5_9BURK|nr:hypothetical protein [Noviherbaspirillum sp. CPCC 100848]MEC4721304.1 hypothetical protein [Noviherbaspirillum sp. CPCC 100848]